MSQVSGPSNPYDASQAELGKPLNNPDDSKLTTVDWILCILCSGIGCIVGIFRLIQGKPNGGKMIAISVCFAILWSIVRFAIMVATEQQEPLFEEPL